MYKSKKTFIGKICLYVSSFLTTLLFFTLLSTLTDRYKFLVILIFVVLPFVMQLVGIFMILLDHDKEVLFYKDKSQKYRHAMYIYGECIRLKKAESEEVQ